ncbi:MAG: type 1 glutamine amidotransferase [Myxococcales bacterium]|nr:type 1 glutamine amidotransferase [Myxococcales bacterium]
MRPSFRLLQAREPDEPVRAEEHHAFALRLDVSPEQILLFDLLEQPISLDAVATGVDAVLVGGSGRYSVLDDTPWMPGFVDLMGELAQRQVPTFASCFGFQALCLALGTDVVTDPDGSELGTFDISLTKAAGSDPVFGALPGTFAAQLGHKDRAVDVPDAAVHLASSARCPVQALRVGAAVYATQFHPELTEEDNRMRFRRYLVEYRGSTGRSDLTEDDLPFAPSDHANALLGAFAKHVL